MSPRLSINVSEDLALIQGQGMASSNIVMAALPTSQQGTNAMSGSSAYLLSRMIPAQEKTTHASATAASSSSPANAALQISINRWARLASAVHTHHTNKEVTISANPDLEQPTIASQSTGRILPIPKQVDLREALTLQHPAGAGTAGPGLTRRYNVSSAEEVRLRRINQTIQIAQRQRMNEKLPFHQLQLVSLQSSAGGHHHPPPQDKVQQTTFDSYNKFKRTPSSNSISVKYSKSSTLLRRRSSDHEDCSNTLSHTSYDEASSSKSSTFVRKRSSEYGDDSTVCSSRTLSSNAHSLTSFATASSHKIHRSTDQISAHSVLSYSMENLHLKFQDHLMNTYCIQDQSLSSGQASSTKSTMANESFSVVTSQPQKLESMGNDSSNPLLSSMISDKAVVSNRPIQVQAEEYSAPANDTTISTNTKNVVISSAVPDCIKYKFVKIDMTPLDIVKEALSSRGIKCDTRPSMEMDDGFFVNLTDMYDHEVINAIRSNDVTCLQRLHAGGANLECGNRFGETLIHLACRRSSTALVAFLINEAGVSLRVRDDYGRTPLHDACWRVKPDLDLLDMLLDLAPELLMLSDKRGHTPLCYARREHWDILIPFLEEKTAKFRSV